MTHLRPAERILIDCDPGIDDAIAILTALGHDAGALQAVTTVAGNRPLATVTENARQVLQLADRTDVTLARGAEHPLRREPVRAGDIHGENGLGAWERIHSSATITPEPAADVIARVVLEKPGAVTIVAIGPLTNIATALREHPELASQAAGLVLMGGAYQRGNITPAAEFNIYGDPDAAAEVFDADWTSLTMVGLELTAQARADATVLRRIRSVGTLAGSFVADLIEWYGDAERRVKGVTGAPAIHDACAVAIALDPSLAQLTPANVKVETVGRYTTGETVVDFTRSKLAGPERFVATALHADRFWEVVTSAVSKLP